MFSSIWPLVMGLNFPRRIIFQRLNSLSLIVAQAPALTNGDLPVLFQETLEALSLSMGFRSGAAKMRSR